MPGRQYTGANGYRYGFNGKENDNEVKGYGNQQDYGFRIYDPRLGKFLSVDPLTKEYPWYTPYQFAGNKPIWAFDRDGLEEAYYYFNYDKDNLPVLNDALSLNCPNCPGGATYYFVQNLNPKTETDKWIQVKAEMLSPGKDYLDWIIDYGLNNRTHVDELNPQAKVTATIGPQIGLKVGIADVGIGANIKLAEAGSNVPPYAIGSSNYVEFNQFANANVVGALGIGGQLTETGNGKGLKSIAVQKEFTFGMTYSTTTTTTFGTGGGTTTSEPAAKLKFGGQFILGAELEISANIRGQGLNLPAIKENLKLDMQHVKSTNQHQ